MRGRQKSDGPRLAGLGSVKREKRKEIRMTEEERKRLEEAGKRTRDRRSVLRDAEKK